MEQVPVNGDYILTQNVRKRNGEWEIVANGVFFKRCLCDTTVEDDEEDEEGCCGCVQMNGRRVPYERDNETGQLRLRLPRPDTCIFECHDTCSCSALW